jgi:hypothetical protein
VASFRQPRFPIVQANDIELRISPLDEFFEVACTIAKMEGVAASVFGSQGLGKTGLNGGHGNATARRTKVHNVSGFRDALPLKSYRG